jgi:hypothetical protein
MLQTAFSVQATDLADSFRSTVGRMRVGPYNSGVVVGVLGALLLLAILGGAIAWFALKK